MQSWASYILIYIAAYSTIAVAIYMFLPWAIRLLAVKMLDCMAEILCKELKLRSQDLLRKGREQVMSSPQSLILGHLVEPYLSKLSSWMLQKMDPYNDDKLSRRYVDICVDRLQRYRMTVALAAAQAAMILLVIGHLLRGVY